MRTLGRFRSRRSMASARAMTAGRHWGALPGMWSEGETQIAGSSISLPAESEAVLPVDHPRLWSAEKPFLYRLSIEVFDASGALTETVWETVGLRRFEIEGVKPSSP